MSISVDECLIRAVHKCVSATRERCLCQVNEEIEEYRVACRLSRGPDQERARHWAGKAREFARRLSRWLPPVTTNT